MSYIKQYYDIKFPFTSNNENGLFLDLNNDINDRVLSDILHVILTPKRSRIRRPDFGTDLIKFIWEPNDEKLWEDIESEVKKCVSEYVNNVTIDDIIILREENNDNRVILDLTYTVLKGNKKIQNNVKIPL